MKKELRRDPATGDGGLSGWVIEFDEYEEYFAHMAKHWEFLDRLWHWFRPPLTEYRIAYEHDGGLRVITPTHQMMALLMRGGVIREMRQIDAIGADGIPVFDGSGKLLPPMTEREALEFIAWKDIPRAVNRRTILTVNDMPKNKERRDEWVLSDDEIRLSAA